jgi:death on curing protein
MAKKQSQKASPKPPVRKAAGKKSQLKKAPPKKALPKKALPKKAPAAKSAAKKSPPKKAAVKPSPRKTPPKKVAEGQRVKAPKRVKSNSATQPSPPLSSAPSRSILPLSSGYPTERKLEVAYLSSQDLVELHKAISSEFGGRSAQPGVVESPFGLQNAVERPRTTVFGRDAYPEFYEKAAAFFFALLQNLPFQTGNRRVALAALLGFCELNERSIDARVLDEKSFENLVKKAATHREHGVPPEEVFQEIRSVMQRAIV